MSTPELGAIVAGAGIAGLAAALEFQQSSPEILVVDASDRPGGVMRTDHVAGFVIERGPNTTQVKAPMLEFLRHLGADDQLLAAQSAGRRRYFYRDGKLVRVPDSPGAFVRSPLLTARGKLRLLAEPFVGRRDATGESVSEFIGRRLGDEVASGLVGPFLTGVYAGDERELGAEAVFPALVDHEHRSGSLAMGMLGGAVASAFGRSRSKGLPGSYSAPNGMGPFARLLAERLVEPPALDSRVTGLHRDGDAWLVFISGPGGAQRLRARHIVIAVPAPQAAEILRGVDTELARALEQIEYAPIVGVPLGVTPSAVREKIDGFGFLVPHQREISLLGCLYMSRLFAGRAPAGRELFQCILGGTHWREVIGQPDDVILNKLHADLDQVLGLDDEPETLAITRVRQAIPQPGRNHPRLVAEIRASLGRLPGIELAGAYLDGISVSDALTSGLNAARSLQGLPIHP
ncbi:MAG: protoporphyrinogen oxidase [Myxococcota bacterium]